MNQLIHGDNLDILKGIGAESVDLIYLDPPFFSNRQYEVIWGDRGEVRSFEDRWSGGVDHYIGWLYERVEAMYRVLKPTGSFFLHCDWHADADIRVDILNKLFGRNNFRNAISWCYTGPSNTHRYFPRKHDIILYYVKDKNLPYTFNESEILVDYDDATLHRRKYAETKKKGIPFKGKPQEEYAKGRMPFDWWCDIYTGGQISAKERIGYPTQKPEALMERIIKCASSEGDLVLDPFMGGGTTIAVADKLNRRWIGIDQSAVAVRVSQMRLQRHQWVTSAPYSVELQKYDYDTLRNQDAFEFESFIINKFGGVPHGKKGGDLGIDGIHADGAPIQVKRSENIVRDVIDKFKSAIERSHKALFDKHAAAKQPVGYIIAFSFGKGIAQEAARLKNKHGIIIRLVRVDEIIPIAPKPMARLDFNEISIDKLGSRTIELSAAGQSECGVSTYIWDMDYNADKGFNGAGTIDREGRQVVKFSAGVFHIAVKAIDNEGQESIVDKTLVVNGGVKWM